MKRFFLSFALCLSLLPAITGCGENTAYIPKGFDDYCQKTFDEWQLPGMAVVVVKDGEIAYLKGFGKTKLDSTGVDVDPVNTQFVICSTTKAFTGALLATVIDDYDVDWKDPVIKHLPEFRLYDEWATRHMTVQEINTHHTGFMSYAMDDLPMFGYDRDDLYDMFSVLQPTYSFRSTYAYNNETYTISAKIIEKYTGMSWDDAIAERIYKPLKMTHSTTGNKDSAYVKSDKLAYGYREVYDVEGDSLIVTPRDDRADGYTWLSAVAPAAFVMTTAADMANWLRMHLNHGVFEGDTVISRKNHDMLFYPQTVTAFGDDKVCTYGQGWTVEQTSRCRFIRHTGLGYGYTSLVGFVPDLNMGIAVLTTNGSSSSAQEGIARKLIDMYYDVEGKDWAHDFFEEFKDGFRSDDEESEEEKPAEEVVAPLQNSAYVGTYFKPVFGDAVVYEKDGALWFKLKAVDSELKHKNGNVFSFHVDGAGHFDLTFSVEYGRARSFTFDINDPIGEFERK